MTKFLYQRFSKIGNYGMILVNGGIRFFHRNLRCHQIVKNPKDWCFLEVFNGCPLVRREFLYCRIDSAIDKIIIWMMFRNPLIFLLPVAALYPNIVATSFEDLSAVRDAMC